MKSTNLKVSANKRIALLVVLLLVFSISVSGGQYDLSWNTIDGGGGTSKGGPYALTGTIGQPDAGTMSDGNYILNGGFLAAGGTNEIWYVDDNAPGDPDPYNPDISDPYENGSPQHPFDSIQETINRTFNEDIILVAEGTYTGNGNRNINFLGKAITLTSSDPNDWDIVEATIINANNSGNTVTFDAGEDANSILRGFTIKGGSYGIKCINGTSPIIERCIVRDNPTGIFCAASGTAPTITNNVIRDNNSSGIRCNPGSAPVVKNNLIYNNKYGLTTMTTGEVVIRNNTVVNNTTWGIRRTSGTAPAISNCIIWNRGDDLFGCTATYSCIQDGDSGVGNISSDPCFADADANDFHLKSTSPCIDIGDPNGDYAGEVDIDGDSRVIDVSGKGDGNVDVDMGADESPCLFVGKVFDKNICDLSLSANITVTQAMVNMWNALGRPQCWCCNGQKCGNGIYTPPTTLDVVDTNDLAKVKESFGKYYYQTGYIACVDFDLSGKVDGSDLAILKKHFGKPVGSTGCQ